MAESPVLSPVVSVLSRYHMRYSSESLLQSDVARVLELAEFGFVREHIFSAKDRADFFIPSIGVVVECKVNGGPSAVIAQLLRYAAHDQVNGVVLVTSRAVHRWPLPMLGGKPFSVVWVSAL